MSIDYRNPWRREVLPVLSLAPMSGVTDAAFRRIVARYGKPDVLLTEFVSCDGLCSRGRLSLYRELWFAESERPIVAQIFGSKPETFARTAELLLNLGFDGIDINTGCPDRSVEKQGAGSALIRHPSRVGELMQALRSVAPHLPISIKTRLGYHENELETWLPRLLETEPAAVTIHARTRQELSKVPARWDELGRAVEIARRLGADTPIHGNGDVVSVAQADELCDRYGLDGFMIGRGIYGNPWLFNRRLESAAVPWPARLKVMLEHTRLFERLFGSTKIFAFMRKFYKAYANGFPEAKELRTVLMTTSNGNEVERLTRDFCLRHGFDLTEVELPAIRGRA